jgi:hypothetical protein
MKSTRRIVGIFAIFLMVTLATNLSAAQSTTEQKTDPKTVPVIDGAAGSCTAEFTVNDGAGAPVYNAKIRVHIDYRWGGFHKLDLEVGTNVDGKARFEGLPAKTKRGLTYYATHGDQEGSAFVDPAENCKAQMTITLAKKNP